MGRKIAVIDCGTNTFNLSIAEFSNGELKFSNRTKRVVKLAEGSNGSNIISKKAITRAINTLSHFHELIKLNGINSSSVYCVGTSAIRDAKNKSSFLKSIKKNTQISILPIDGNKEALYIFKGIQNEGIFGNECVLIMDIGGGSVEFIIAKNNKIIWKKSYPIGAARILNYIQPNFPLSILNKKKVNNLFDKTFEELIAMIYKHKPASLIGSSGSFDSLISIRNKTNFKSNTSNQQFLSIKDFSTMHNTLMKKDYSSLLKTPGLLRMRAKMIVPSIMLIKFVLSKMHQPTILVAKNSLKEGLAFSILLKN